MNNLSSEGRKSILITGGAGFIGSHFVELLASSDNQLIVLDSLSYAGRRENLEPWLGQNRLEFVHGRIEDVDLLQSLFAKYQFDAVVNFAAESHVDRSIEAPSDFIQTNIIGVYQLLEASKKHWLKNKNFRFLQVSTDEVYGQLGENGFFTEESPYQPNSPYSASKASADMLCRAWFHTYKLPVIVTNCSNNYGARQYPEKLIPVMIANCLNEKPLPVYGKGQNIRDWIYVKDHCYGLQLALERGQSGETYCFGGKSELKNIDLVHTLCEIMDELRPRKSGALHKELISYVTDRPGHDFRYAIDDRKAQKELGFERTVTFKQGLKKTVEWYLANTDWLKGKDQ